VRVPTHLAPCGVLRHDLAHRTVDPEQRDAGIGFGFLERAGGERGCVCLECYDPGLETCEEPRGCGDEHGVRIWIRLDVGVEDAVDPHHKA